MVLSTRELLSRSRRFRLFDQHRDVSGRIVVGRIRCISVNSLHSDFNTSSTCDGIRHRVPICCAYKRVANRIFLIKLQPTNPPALIEFLKLEENFVFQFHWNRLVCAINPWNSAFFPSEVALSKIVIRECGWIAGDSRTSGALSPHSYVTYARENKGDPRICHLSCTICRW